MFYCGIDLASRTSALCIVDANDCVLREAQIPTDEVAFRGILQNYPECLCVVEAAPLAESIKRMVESLGHRCVIVDTRAAQGLFAARKKTDRNDARTLAKMARTGWYNEVCAKTTDQRLLRTRLTARVALVHTQVRLQNAVLGLLKAQGLRLRAANNRQFASVIRNKVTALAEGSALLPIIEPLLLIWEQVDQEVSALDKQLHALAKSQQLTRLLMTVPGVGALTALAFVATIGDPERFRRPEQIGDYVGLAPGVYQSGDVDRRGRITKAGDAMLRSLLVNAATVVLYQYRKHWSLKAWALRLKERKGAGKARVALARKLAILLWKILKTQTPFILPAAA
jgi:transposase